MLEKSKTLDNIRRSRVELTKGLHSSRLIRIIDQVQHFTMALQQKILNGVVLVTITENLVKVSHTYLWNFELWLWKSTDRAYKVNFCEIKVTMLLCNFNKRSVKS